jgi:hypothetical protein
MNNGTQCDVLDLADAAGTIWRKVEAMVHTRPAV